MPEPMCCGEPMVHNSATGEYECADAYFRLVDDGVLDGSYLLVDIGELYAYQLDRYVHLLGSRIPDASVPSSPEETPHAQ